MTPAPRDLCLQPYTRTELAYLAEGMALRHGDLVAQKNWLNTFQSSADIASGQPASKRLLAKPYRAKDDGPLGNLKGSPILKVIHDHYLPSENPPTRTLYLSEKFFTSREVSL
jgi:hypothetical protein